jgi:hypothetical protein
MGADGPDELDASRGLDAPAAATSPKRDGNQHQGADELPAYRSSAAAGMAQRRQRADVRLLVLVLSRPPLVA